MGVNESEMIEAAEMYLLMVADKMKVKTDIELNSLLNDYAGIFAQPPHCFTLAQYEIISKRVASKFNVNVVPGVVLSYEHESWFLDSFNTSEKKFWKRYRMHLNNNGRSPTVIGEIDTFTNKVLDCCGDPSSSQSFHRYGLVIGDVQSGKTGTFIGMMCKAADVKYNVFIVLTGMSNNLRNQTQIRIDEGFVGYRRDEHAQGRRVGVGKLDPTTQAYPYTDGLTDFKGKISINPSVVNVPIVLVVKKNSTVLEKVYANLNIAQNTKGTDKIDYSLFLIDDEADNASINTLEDSVSTINSKIRKILNLFTKSTYIGFTATPYANVFIDPDAEADNIGDDLFPKDFVSCIPTPGNYIGPKDIFDVEGKYFTTMVRNNEDMNKCLSPQHKNGVVLSYVPDSLSDAVDCYILACTIRDLEGQSTEPMSMMIHSSRFIKTQTSIVESIADEYYRIRGDISNYSHLPVEKSMQNRTIKHLHDTWEKEYSTFGNGKYVWSEILNQLDNSLEKVQVFKINSESGDILDYNNHPDLRAIVIGGNSLSRGLTLNGLLVAYFHRVSTQYDTLMQMGRWFGYRDEYVDLCRVWISKFNAEWFSYIANATEELKNEVKTMELQGKSPRDFGLYVRQDIRGLRITSRAKMLHTGEKVVRFSSSAVVWDTSRVFVDKNHIHSNYDACEKFLKIISDSRYGPSPSDYKNVIWKKVPRSYIIDFVSAFAFDLHNDKPFETLTDVINSNEKMETWDVAIQSGSSERNSHYGLCEAKRTKFTTTLESDNITFVELAQRRLISPTNTQEGLDKDIVEKITEDFGKNHKKKDGSPAAPDAKAFLTPDRRPLLLIYYLDLSYYCEDNSEEPYKIEKLTNLAKYFDENKALSPIGLAFCFPDLGPGESNEPSIIITNKIWSRMQRTEEIDNGAEEESD